MSCHYARIIKTDVNLVEISNSLTQKSSYTLIQMLRILPILLLMLQAVPISAPAEACPSIHDASTCCGGDCACSEQSCFCESNKEEPPAPSKTPFSITSIDFAPPLAPVAFRLPALIQSGELISGYSANIVIASNNCRQALLGRWQN